VRRLRAGQKKKTLDEFHLLFPAYGVKIEARFPAIAGNGRTSSGWEHFVFLFNLLQQFKVPAHG
jgi:hypothetical protein